MSILSTNFLSTPNDAWKLQTNAFEEVKKPNSLKLIFIKEQVDREEMLYEEELKTVIINYFIYNSI